MSSVRNRSAAVCDTVDVVLKTETGRQITDNIDAREQDVIAQRNNHMLLVIEIITFENYKPSPAYECEYSNVRR